MIYLWPILISIVFYVLVGTLWYSKLLFGNLWMKYLGVEEDSLEMKPTDYIFSILGAIFGTFLVATILEVVGNYTVLNGLIIGALVAGLVYTTSSSQVIFSGKKWQSWLIDSGYHATALLIISIVLGAWNSGTFV